MTNSPQPSTTDAVTALKKNVLMCGGIYMMGYYGAELIRHFDDSIACGRNVVSVAFGIGLFAYGIRMKSKATKEKTLNASSS